MFDCALAVPDSYLIFESNQFDSNFQCLQDPQCSRFALPQDDDKKRNSGDQTLLTCTGPNSTLFNGVVGRNLRRTDDFEQGDFLRHYTWQQDITSNPTIEMFFNVPLVEVPNITMYFYREGQVRVPRISMCFSRTLSFSPCDDIELPNGPGRLGMIRLVVWPISLLTNVTSVTYLRINIFYDSDEEDEFIFLSEIRIAERLQGTVKCMSLDIELYSVANCRNMIHGLSIE